MSREDERDDGEPPVVVVNIVPVAVPAGKWLFKVVPKLWRKIVKAAKGK